MRGLWSVIVAFPGYIHIITLFVSEIHESCLKINYRKVISSEQYISKYLAQRSYTVCTWTMLSFMQSNVPNNSICGRQTPWLDCLDTQAGMRLPFLLMTRMTLLAWCSTNIFDLRMVFNVMVISCFHHEFLINQWRKRVRLPLYATVRFS